MPAPQYDRKKCNRALKCKLNDPNITDDRDGSPPATPVGVPAEDNRVDENADRA